jgi:autotransporter-associated beta strand protein
MQTNSNTIGGLSGGSYLTTTTAGTNAAEYLPTSNVDVDSSPGQINAAISVSTLRFNSMAASTLTLQGTNTTNGILVTSGVGNNTSLITGGAVQGALVGGAAARDLIIHQHNTAGTLEIASQIVDNTAATGLTKNGPGLLKISNPLNNFTGAIFVGDGTLQLGANEVLPHASSGFTLFTTFDMNGFNETTFNIGTTDNAIITNSSLNPSTLTINSTANSSIIGMIEDGASTVSLVKSGAGTLALGLNLGPENSFSGPTTINADSGVVTLNNSNALKNSTVTAATDKLAFGTVVLSRAFTLGGLSGNGNLALANAAGAAVTVSVGNNNSNTTYSGILSGVGSFAKVGTGELNLTSVHTYTGSTTVANGLLNVDTTGSIDSSPTIHIEANGSLLTNHILTTTLNVAGTATIRADGGTAGASKGRRHGQPARRSRPD